ncbi:hypothetical protein [Halorubrum gandharaense]
MLEHAIVLGAGVVAAASTAALVRLRRAGALPSSAVELVHENANP